MIVQVKKIHILQKTGKNWCGVPKFKSCEGPTNKYYSNIITKHFKNKTRFTAKPSFLITAIFLVMEQQKR